ncbi:6-phosphogluconolactonase [Grifola frondosa]|uniref:6-phosphogluconolactonase n=1 Tax=Grifola frondosa TaxID=5627 RepID=A0A1C7LZX1_GRIFR|nr:6-phosphogluconolactonase [Grifola frondosa]
MIYHILVASYTNEIYTLAFDPDVPSLTLASSLTVGHHPSWITRHPTDTSLIFTGLEQPDGKVVALRYDAEGRGTIVGEAPSGGGHPCSLLATKDQLLIGNYLPGTFATIPLSPEPPHLQGPPAVVAFTGTGPNVQRQSAPHQHQVALHPRARSWHVDYAPGAGPRHIAFHDDIMYTVLELANEVTAHRVPPLPTPPTLLSTAPTMRVFPDAAHMLAGEILVAPPSTVCPAPFVYVSNRDDPSSEGDAIAVFSADGTLTRVAEVRTELQHVRGMVVGGRVGNGSSQVGCMAPG